MIVKLTPSMKFVCDRCGKEEYPNEDGYIEAPHEVRFVEDRLDVRNKFKAGQVCQNCFDEFWEIANNFFDEVNKERSENGKDTNVTTNTEEGK